MTLKVSRYAINHAFIVFGLCSACCKAFQQDPFQAINDVEVVLTGARFFLGSRGLALAALFFGRDPSHQSGVSPLLGCR